MYTIEDKIQHFEGQLVRISTSDGFEILDYYNCHDTKPSIKLAANQYVIQIKNIETVKFVKDDFKDLYNEHCVESLMMSRHDH